MSHISLDELMQVWKGTIGSISTSYLELSIDTGLSLERGVLALIHRIDFTLWVGASTTNDTEVHLSRESKAAILTPEDDDIIAYAAVRPQISTNGGFVQTNPHTQMYIPPIAYAKSKIYFGVKADAAPAPDDAYVRVYYSLVKVREQDFFKVASAIAI